MLIYTPLKYAPEAAKLRKQLQEYFRKHLQEYL